MAKAKRIVVKKVVAGRMVKGKFVRGNPASNRQYVISLSKVPDGVYTEDYLGASRNQPTLAAAKKVVAQFKRAMRSHPENFEPGMRATIHRER